jgi:hypothetical protein
LCGTDQKDYSEFALEWLIDELVDDGEEIVCLRVVEKDSSIASTSSIEAGRYRKEAQDLLDSVIKKNSQEEKTISLVMELAVGRVQDIIQRMVSPPVQASFGIQLTFPRFKSMSPQYSSSAPVAAVSVACKASSQVPSPSTAFSNRQSP